MKFDLWTDGSGKGIDPERGEPGGWAYKLVAHRDGHVIKEVAGVGGAIKTSNNRMELSAVLFGLSAVQRPVNLTVYSDSEYVTKAFTEGYLDKWVQRDFRKTKNDDLWKAILAQFNRLGGDHRVHFRWVPGHAKGAHPINEECDKLAGMARLAVVECLETGAPLSACGFHVDGFAQDVAA